MNTNASAEYTAAEDRHRSLLIPARRLPRRHDGIGRSRTDDVRRS